MANTPKPASLPRSAYADMFGPTVGDRIRLADTSLEITVERDFTTYGEEVKFGGGKVIRDGMGQSQVTNAGGAVDTVITNAVVLDHWGIVKCDVGIVRGRIFKLGKAGNPDVQPGVDIVVGPGTEVIAGEGKILTAGGFDSHIHFICPQQIEEALCSGVTTMLGGGTGPAHGTFATTCTPGPWHIARMIEAADAFPMNLAFAGKGNAVPAGEPRRDGAGRRLRAQAARGLGHHAGGDRHLPVGGGRPRHPGHDPHRHAQRIGLRRGHDRGLQGPDHPRLPHGGRRRRPCAGHHQGRRAAERAAVLHQPDAALHAQHHRRASRHAHGLPPPRPVDPRGSRLRGEPDPARDDRGRGHPARYRRALDDVVATARPWAGSARSSSAPGRPPTR